jgi:5-methylcytosine-specific restriction enzyme subunit McrC
LNSVYRELGITDDQVIPAYFIYPADLFSEINEQENITKGLLDKDFIHSDKAILETDCRKSTSYKEMYLQLVELPYNPI